ncbi:TetR/AcrR family transcriptional regulator [Paracoccus sp. Z330]|uniref:TetR/AcrR family transcriptional regulator n=1 Tax=Paracoccus onchidii TaxID=3017813 RepID=A0ABT4ZAL4_9RHOB|nr:TetR/AcrR family transcriptional regulator [Paracoccus onchidii]MDB6176003.1 TetR/AcrR family transcriptional regulator [Paracoccus onchidii]
MRQRLIRSGLIYLTEKGYGATGVDEILAHAELPKGSFYHYFRNKEAFGLALVDAYQAYFAGLLDRAFNAPDLPPLQRLRSFTRIAEKGMEKHAFSRGCLVGNLGQEMGALPEPFRDALQGVLLDWQARTAQCLLVARHAGELGADIDCDELAAFFWTGWEGAVLRAKLDRNPAPLRQFADMFFNLVQSRSVPDDRRNSD